MNDDQISQNRGKGLAKRLVAISFIAIGYAANVLKGSATILFVAHIVPQGLKVDEALRFGPRLASAPGS